MATYRILSRDDNSPRPLSVATPIIKWAGGKRNLLYSLKPLIPFHMNTYFEPFFGGGALFFALDPNMMNFAVLGDANSDLIEMYRMVRDAPKDVMDELKTLQRYALDMDMYYRIRDTNIMTDSPVHRAARFIYLNKTCYNGLYRVNRSGKFNVPFGRYSSPPQLYDRENLLAVSARLGSSELVCQDFESTVASAERGDFAYIDPPYVPLNATSNFTKYTSSSFGEDQQRRLAVAVRELDSKGCYFLVSNSDTPLVRELYCGLPFVEVKALRNINSDAGGRSRIVELAIYNFPLNEARLQEA